MVHPFRSALLVIAALSASSVAPAQVGPVSVVSAPEPLLASGTNEMPAAVIPTVLETIADLPAADPLAPTDDAAQEAEPRPTGDLASMVAQLRSSEPGSSEMECLAGAIYFEAKSETLKGQLAVGHVVANRAASGRFPST